MKKSHFKYCDRLIRYSIRTGHNIVLIRFAGLNEFINYVKVRYFLNDIMEIPDYNTIICHYDNDKQFKIIII